MIEDESATQARMPVEGLNRRQMLTTCGGVLLATAGLWQPAGFGAEVQAGAAHGAMGGRHGKNRRGRDKAKRRGRGDRAGDNKQREKAPRSQLGVKDIKLTFFNDTSLPKSYQFWYCGDPAFDSGWDLEFAPGELPAGGQLPCQSPTRAAGIWMEGHFGAFWVEILNPLLGTPEVSFRWGGDLQKGSGHSGGAVVGERMVRLEEGEEHRWIVQAHVATVIRERDDQENKNFSVRLRQTW